MNPRAPGKLVGCESLLLAKFAQLPADPNCSVFLKPSLGRATLVVRVARLQIIQDKVPGDFERIARPLPYNESRSVAIDPDAQNFAPIVLRKQASRKSVHPSIPKGDKELMRSGVVDAIPQSLRGCHMDVRRWVVTDIPSELEAAAPEPTQSGISPSPGPSQLIKVSHLIPHGNTRKRTENRYSGTLQVNRKQDPAGQGLAEKRLRKTFSLWAALVPCPRLTTPIMSTRRS